jgi:dihydropteroate synthase
MNLLGILNVTPDSFSDGGAFPTVDAAVAHGRALLDEGAAMIDVGGESTRPGAAVVSVEEEIRRVVPVVERLARHGPVSIDTRRAAVARAALDAGATLVNDVSGAADPDMLPLVAARGCGIVLMHMRGDPATMQRMVTYDDVCAEVWDALDARRDVARAAGIPDDAILLDPGIGFAKDLAGNLALLRDLPRRTPTRRVLLGASRKSFIGSLTGQKTAAERLEGSLAVALHARDAGVAWLRVHDVAATARALRVWEAVRGAP